MSLIPFSAQPAQTGLYDPACEHDACGVAMVATLRGTPGHDIVVHALTALHNLDHRGATGADPDVGDGAGILMQVPDAFLRAVVDFELPRAGRYAVGMAFLPVADAQRGTVVARIEAIAAQESLAVLGWREVPIAADAVGRVAREVMPHFVQLFLAGTGPGDGVEGLELDRMTYCARKRIEHELDVYFPSLSARTLVYKGMLTTEQLATFYPDLADERLVTELALVHSRFSTNTFPSWPLAHPYRLIAHNGEINTVKGNRNWMAARESLLYTEVIPGDLRRIFPIITDGRSDSASFDEVLELLHLGGRSLPHSVLMMIPEAWEHHAQMSPARRAFYQYHSALMEPWDGPACVTFTDGTLVGAVLDRNGLRPSRYWVTDDQLVVLGSEAGVLDLDPASIVHKGRLQPGRMFLVDTAAGRLISDDEVKTELAYENPYQQWLEQELLSFEDLPEREHILHTRSSVARRQQIFGYTQEELRLIIAPMARAGAEALGSMGTDTPIAVLSSRPRMLFDYFSQQFAQVTNPPLDAIREELVTSLGTLLGPGHNLLTCSHHHARHINLPFPVIDNDELAKIVHLDAGHGIDDDSPLTAVVSGRYDVAGGASAMKSRLAMIFKEVSAAIARGATFVVLTDRDADADRAPIPSLLLTAAVHHHLIREKTRTRVGLIVEAGDVREVHHVALLIGYGAAAVNPYLAMETVEDMVRSRVITEVTSEHAVHNLIKALGKGVLKVMSKMGISTVASYRGAQVFECIGLSQDVIDAYFTGTTSQLGGVGLEVIAAEVAARHSVAYPPSGIPQSHRTLAVGGEYQWRREGEPHLFDPETVFRLQHSTRQRRYDIFKQYSRRVDEQSQRLMTLRGLFELRAGTRRPVPIDEVEPVSEIVKRFSTGAMSYGSISQEAHETLAIAMNQLGARSNTGEGGEDVERLLDPLRRSAIKQVASGRFGVTSLYLTQASDIQIKMAQGAKPGEGGQLPGTKVYPWVARTRHSTPGVGLISPPPHHDIYSIEDLKQLIHDLKNANPNARIHVKLVAEFGVGTVAAGVAKAKADVVDRIVVQADGQLKTGRDVVIAALLGAEEYGFATAPLVVSGCIMMRVCHQDTCPVGVATQNPELRQRFSGRPEFIVTFFEYIAAEVRELLAQLGFRSLQEAVGQTNAIDVRKAVEHWKASGLDLSPILAEAVPGDGSTRYRSQSQEHGLGDALDNELIAGAGPALADGTPVTLRARIRNVNRTAGTMLGHAVTSAHHDGLPDDTIDVTLTGQAGQSLGAFLPRGVTLRLYGDANDYVGKGLSGGRVIVRPDVAATLVAQDHVIAGNVIGYGATSGELFLRGQVGERFCVRNSGATAVVEGVGDHGCEYMTGGVVVILGPVGRNFAAGMSGGLAFVLDVAPQLVNPELVGVGPVRERDIGLLRELVQRHAQATGSPVAQRLLADWPAALGRFSLILPHVYQRVLDVREQALAEGLDLDGPQVWARIMEVSRG